ncbi:OLC1v1038230C1 [Oldenlandia corymbosa var. corymbosa]|uniref:OLC1v1038230C1 n=1 Tax=Oldenlandia corymbosa var. corymbosa TaxID=529605 RepID=A0AAV1CZA8_OLDCO|nr:OLC1v1038230C1 [Oldenlandia corymbosa var. corymbosa]
MGSSFAYCCAMCEIDLHVNCAFLPHKISHQSHHRHELRINYGEPDINHDDKVSQTSQDHCNPESENPSAAPADPLAELLEVQLQMQRAQVCAQMMSSIISAARIG